MKTNWIFVLSCIAGLSYSAIGLRGAGGNDESKTIEITGTGRLQFYNYSTLR